MNFSRLFRSRWAALWWAAGVVWFAYDVASAGQPDTVPTAAENIADVQALVNAGF